MSPILPGDSDAYMQVVLPVSTLPPLALLPSPTVLDIDEQIDAMLCFVPASMASQLKTGQEAHTGAIKDDEGEAQGEVVYVANQGESETGNFAVKVRFDNKQRKLLANRLLRISIQTKPGHKCLSIPESAIQEDDEKPTVIVVQEEQRKNDKGRRRNGVYVARRLVVVLGVRDRRHKQTQVEILQLMAPEKEEEKKPVGSIETAQFIVEGGQGLQTGDLLKQEAGDFARRSDRSDAVGPRLPGAVSCNIVGCPVPPGWRDLLLVTERSAAPWIYHHVEHCLESPPVSGRRGSDYRSAGRRRHL